MTQRGGAFLEVLVHHDGELADICELLGELGCPFTERRGADAPVDAARSWELIVVTPARVQHLETLLADPETQSIAITGSGCSKGVTLRLFRAGVKLVVRRPVHPATLRGVLMHALYRGPERRRDARVCVGLPVRYRLGWWPRRGLLQELSRRGARLLLPREVPPRQKLTLALPGERGAVDVRAEVVRCTRDLAHPGSWGVGVAFERGPGPPPAHVRELLRAYSVGPGVLPERLAPRPNSGDRERRVAERRPYPRRVIALGDGGARVLLGRDLSLGGMRVEARADLRPGQRFRVALHACAGEVPLVVEAETVRDDGAGLGLRFVDLAPNDVEHLTKMLDHLPVLTGENGGALEPRFLAELLEPGAGANPAESAVAAATQSRSDPD